MCLLRRSKPVDQMDVVLVVADVLDFTALDFVALALVGAATAFLAAGLDFARGAAFGAPLAALGAGVESF